MRVEPFHEGIVILGEIYKEWLYSASIRVSK